MLRTWEVSKSLLFFYQGITSKILTSRNSQNLWAKLRKSVEGDFFDGVKEEKYEDSHGNGLNRAQYEDLARQGLL